MREGGGGCDEGCLQEAAECVKRPRALRWQIRPTAEREPAVSAEGKVPPVEFVEKKLRSYCKYQEEASKNKKCAPSPTALLRCKAAAVRDSPPLLSNASHVVCRGDATKPNSMCYYIEPVKRDFSTPVANGALPSLVAATHSFRPS